MLYFNGYCPECQLQGRQVAMKLNGTDFWECPESGLQIVLSPPMAAILRWRGQGIFKTDPLTPTRPEAKDLQLVEASKEEGHEIMPDAAYMLNDDQQLDWYLHEIYDNWQILKQHQFNTKDPVFELQRQQLARISKDDWQEIFDSLQQFYLTGITINIGHYKGFKQWHQLLVRSHIIFEFNWHAWHRGWVNIRNIQFDYRTLSLLELSMCLSAIFLSEPYDEGSIEFYFNNKTMEKIMAAMEEKVKPQGTA
jgi:hypothetical protein